MMWYLLNNPIKDGDISLSKLHIPYEKISTKWLIGTVKWGGWLFACSLRCAFCQLKKHCPMSHSLRWGYFVFVYWLCLDFFLQFSKGFYLADREGPRCITVCVDSHKVNGVVVMKERQGQAVLSPMRSWRGALRPDKVPHSRVAGRPFPDTCVYHYMTVVWINVGRI